MLRVRTTQICKVPATSDAQLLPLLLIGINCLWPKANHTRRSGRAYVLCASVFLQQQLRRHGNNSAESNLSLASGERTTRVGCRALLSLCVLLLVIITNSGDCCRAVCSNTNIVVGPILFVCLRIPCGRTKHLCSNQLGESGKQLQSR